MQGRVFRRGNGWSYTVDVGMDPATGRRRQRMKGGFATSKAAEAIRVGRRAPKSAPERRDRPQRRCD